MAGEIVHSERAEEADGKREQSSIVFPYLDLSTAIDVAQSVYQRSGLGNCNLDELAAQMGQTVSGAFRMKTGTAKIFDLIEKDGKSSIKLSELGRQIVSPETERSARAEAFMRVPLYSAIFEKYKGHMLPPARALEREMQGLGVSSKQTDKARQAFERSARQAGYFESGEDRLVRPRTDVPTRPIENSAVVEEHISPDAGTARKGHSTVSIQRGGYHPFVQGLLDELPGSDDFATWTIDDQAEWLNAAASIFKLLSKSKGRIIVSVASEKIAATDQ
jgi:hypothetical protein